MLVIRHNNVASKARGTREETGKRSMGGGHVEGCEERQEEKRGRNKRRKEIKDARKYIL
jgi:hypothetical protein